MQSASKQDGANENASPGCWSPPEQHQSKNSTSQDGYAQKHFSSYRGHRCNKLPPSRHSFQHMGVGGSKHAGNTMYHS